MKRYSGLHDKLCTIENIEVADDNARKNKNKKYGINKHDKNRQYENEDLVDKLLNLKYKTSKYSLYKIYEPKERIIYRLPYYPDRIAHHAIMNVVKDIWTKSFIHNTYSCIEGRGIHLCASNLKRDLRKYPNETTYCLKLDIKKFYPSILELILLEMVKLIMLIVEIKLYFILYIDLIIFLLILKLLNMIGVFILKVKKKKLNLKHNIL